MTSPPQSLRFKEKLSYGLGDTASNFFFQTFNIFLLYFYTDVFGIPAAAVGTMFFVSKIWDAVNDPLMGIAADRTQSRWGKFRPYILWMALPYGVLGYFMFLGPDFSPTGKLVYAYVTYSLMMMAYTAINVPYSALLGVISPSSQDRVSVSSYRFICAFGGGFLITLLVRPLVAFFGAEDEAYGFQVTMALFAVASAALFLVTFAFTRERVQPKPGDSATIGRDLGLLFRNGPWLALFLAAIFTMTNVAVRNAVTVHFFKYNVGDDGARWLWFMDKTTVYMSSAMLALIAGVFCAPWVSKRFDKRRALMGLTLLNAACLGAFYFIPTDQFGLLMLFNLAGAFFAGPTPALVWAMYADTADYSEWKYGRRATALIFSASLFAQKLGLAVGAGMAGWMLGYYGFVANVEQSERSLFGIRVMYSLVPAGFAILNAAAVYFYRLDDSLVRRIEAELGETKASTS